MNTRKKLVCGLILTLCAPSLARARNTPETKMKPTPVTTARQADPGESDSSSSDAPSGPDWKGAPEGNRFEIGGLSGMGIIDSKPGWAVLFTGAVNILEKGFIPDVNDTVFVETEVGPLLRFGTTPIQYSVHMRWDFRQNRTWAFYALAGVGGHVADDGFGGTRFLIFPRVGLGAMMDIGKIFNLRAEVSHELIAAGISLPLF